MEVVPSVDREKGIPAAAAAPAPAVSPSVCIRRVNPMGAIPNGNADRPPSTSVDISSRETSVSTPGWSSTSSNAFRARAREISRSADPSV